MRGSCGRSAGPRGAKVYLALTDSACETLHYETLQKNKPTESKFFTEKCKQWEISVIDEDGETIPGR